MEINKTGWYGGDQKPVHIGVYERDMTLADSVDQYLIYSYWNGDYWTVSGDTPEKAVAHIRLLDSNYQDLPWRGLTR